MTGQQLIHGLGTVLVALAAAYAVIAYIAATWAAARLRRNRVPAQPQLLPAVTVLKPLCGGEHSLYRCLRSFCEQDYPRFQIVCGVREADDPAIAVVRRLQDEFPALDLQLTIDATQHGTSAKVSNLINMLRVARYSVLVISDSDVHVAPGYLASVVAPLTDPAVGLVTCGYRGLPRPGLWSRLGALFINDWFMPSAYVAALFGSRSFAFGVTIALRRDALDRIGGLVMIADQLADDYRLGELTRRAGLRTVLADIAVDTSVDEGNLAELAAHELRWLRTIRSIRPLGYAFSVVTFSVPVAMLGVVLAGGQATALVMLAIAVIARLMLHVTTHSEPARAHGVVRDLSLLPVADALIFVLWCWSFTSRRVRWRRTSFEVSADGSVHPVA